MAYHVARVGEAGFDDAIAATVGDKLQKAVAAAV